MSAWVGPGPGAPRPLPADRLLAVATFVSVAVAAYIAFIHFRIISCPGPMEYREGAIVATTDLLLRGGDPYALSNLPPYTNVYGAFYNLTVWPFAKLFGNGFAVHRIVSAAYLIAVLFLVFRVMRQMCVRSSIALVAAVLFYADLAARTLPTFQALAMPCSAISRPDSLGLLLFLVSVLVPWRCKFSRGSLILACVTSVLAFFTKPYFVIGAPMVTAYLFLFRSKSRGFAYGMLFLAMMGASLAYVVARHECFFSIVISANQRSLQLKTSHLFNQLWSYITSVPGTTVLFCLAAYGGVRKLLRLRRMRGINLRNLGTLWPLNRPLLAMPADFLWFVTICCATLLAWRLGRHIGNAMLYFYQLLTPFVLLIVVRFLRRYRGRRNSMLTGLLLLDLVLLLIRGLPAPPQAHREAWDEWRTILAGKHDVYVAPPLAPFALEKGLPIYDDGMSEYMVYFAMLYPSTDFDRRLISHVDAFRERMKEKLRREEFDLIILPVSGDSQMFTTVRWHLVFEHYRPVRKVPLPMDWSPNFQGLIMEPIGKPEGLPAANPAAANP